MQALPLDLPGHTLSQQLTFLAKWACLEPALLLSRQEEIAPALQSGNRPKAEKVMLFCCPPNPWPWSAYEAFSAQHGRVFHPDAAQDMAAHLYDKLYTRHHALYRKNQMEAIKDFRPYWQMKGRCLCQGQVDPKALTDCELVSPADDPFWQSDDTPWNCKRHYCRCQVYSLTAREFANRRGST